MKLPEFVLYGAGLAGVYLGVIAAASILAATLNVASARFNPQAEQHNVYGRLERVCARKAIGFSPHGRNTLCIDSRGKRELTIDRGWVVGWGRDRKKIYANEEGKVELYLEGGDGRFGSSYTLPNDFTPADASAVNELYEQAAAPLEEMLEQRSLQLTIPLTDTPKTR